MISFAPELVPLLGLVTGSIDTSGALLQANAGFLRPIDTPGPALVGDTVARFFIPPDFASLLKMAASDSGEIDVGLLTLGDCAGKTRTLKSRAWHAVAAAG